MTHAVLRFSIAPLTFAALACSSAGGTSATGDAGAGGATSAGGASSSAGGATGKGGSSAPGGASASKGGSSGSAGGAATSLGGTSASVGGASASVGGASASVGGASASMGGSSSSKGGTSSSSGGASASVGGASASVGGSSSGGASTSVGGTSAGVGGSPGAGGNTFGGGGAGMGGTSSAGGAAGSGGSLPTCAGAATAEVFGQSAATLYRVDPTTKTVTVVGDFQGCNDSVIDIALDKTGQMYGTTFSSFVKIDKNTAKCTLIKSGSYPNSLSFVPEGTVYPNKEALVGYNGSTYVEIDPTNGNVTTKGSISGGLVSSGDIVSVIGGDTFLTVNGTGCNDCVVTVNPVTGDLIKNLGPLPYGAVYGLAFWAGIAYGFDSAGELFSYDVMTGATQKINVPNPPPNLSFYGAGSTTCAPAHKPLR